MDKRAGQRMGVRGAEFDPVLHGAYMRGGGMNPCNVCLTFLSEQAINIFSKLTTTNHKKFWKTNDDLIKLLRGMRGYLPLS